MMTNQEQARAILSPSDLLRMRRARWITFGLLALAFMLAFFHRLAPAVLSSELQQAFRTSGAELGMLAAAYFYAYMLMQIPSGVLADTLGARKAVTIGLTLAGFGGLLFAFAEGIGLAMVGRFLIGAGVAFGFLATLKVISQWFFDRQFATYTGLTILLGNIGAIFSATPLAWALGFTGWRMIFVTLGIASLLLAVLVACLVRNRPGDIGLPSMRALEGKPEHPRLQVHWLDGLKRVMRNTQTWPGFVSSFCQGGAFFSFAGLWAVPYLRDIHGMSRTVAANHVTLLLIGFAIGSMSIGMISDRMGRRRPLMLACFWLNIAVWLPLVFCWQLPGAASWVLFFLFGVSSSGYTITLATTKEHNAPALSGMATGVVNTGTFMGAAVLQPFLGWAMDYGWDGAVVDGVRAYSAANYQVGFGILVVALALGLVFAYRVRETFCRYLVAE
ncbi:MAG: putative sulfoacetate transporter SauU [Betaproteobacteria bacterium ADurb.Bin341]|nr:MAG: putative sulfoacetate transporter SauU [Betaproteobacteria bacterium ADurb.Bin341]